MSGSITCYVYNSLGQGGYGESTAFTPAQAKRFALRTAVSAFRRDFGQDEVVRVRFVTTGTSQVQVHGLRRRVNNLRAGDVVLYESEFQKLTHDIGEPDDEGRIHLRLRSLHTRDSADIYRQADDEFLTDHDGEPA